MKKIGIYIHIPFCKKKCYYCDFVSFADKKEIEKKYINCLLKEIENFFNKHPDIDIETIYIGGGTPSYIEAESIEKIMNLLNKKIINKSKNKFPKEITIEINPGTASREKLNKYKQIGINRISIGLQSTNDMLLKEIGRIHNFQEFLNTYKLTRQEGFDNVNVDLMIGLPKQSILDIKESLDKIEKLQPNHISIYSLIVEEKTPISQMIENGTLKLPNENLERNMYWYIKNKLELMGFKHYEISNFSKPGFESKHNTDCWKQKEYIGFGIAAHSYIDGIRFSNITNIEQYIENITNNKFDENRIIHEKQNKISKEKEFMILGLRMIDGIKIQDFKNKFGENPIFLFREELNKLVSEELIQIDKDQIRLTNRGLDLANVVWEEFV